MDKVSEAFELPVTIDGDNLFDHDGAHCTAVELNGSHRAKAAALAINSHDQLVEALEEAVSIMGLFDEDICCCGSHLDDHGIGENHSYVSQYDYAVSDIINKSQQAIALAKGEA